MIPAATTAMTWRSPTGPSLHGSNSRHPVAATNSPVAATDTATLPSHPPSHAGMANGHNETLPHRSHLEVEVTRSSDHRRALPSPTPSTKMKTLIPAEMLKEAHAVLEGQVDPPTSLAAMGTLTVGVAGENRSSFSMMTARRITDDENHPSHRRRIPAGGGLVMPAMTARHGGESMLTMNRCLRSSML